MSQRFLDIKSYLKTFKDYIYYVPGEDSYYRHTIVHTEMNEPFSIFLLSIIILMCPVLGLILSCYFCRFSHIAHNAEFKIYWLDKTPSSLCIQKHMKKLVEITDFYQPYYGYKKYTGEEEEREIISEYIRYKLLPFIIPELCVSFFLWFIIFMCN